MDVASPHTRKLLRDYKRQSQDRSQLMYLQRFRATSSTLLRVEAGQLTLRGAFSHIPFWQAAGDAVQRVVLAPPGGAATPAASPTASVQAPLQRAGASNAAALAAATPPPPPFRPSSLQVSLGVQQGTLVLCNDKAETFGAPDVLQCSLAGVSLAYAQATLLPVRPANKAGKSATGRAALARALWGWEGHGACWAVVPSSSGFVPASPHVTRCRPAPPPLHPCSPLPCAAPAPAPWRSPAEPEELRLLPQLLHLALGGAVRRLAPAGARAGPRCWAARGAAGWVIVCACQCTPGRGRITRL